MSALETIHPDEERVAALSAKMRQDDLTEVEFDEMMALRARNIVHRDIKPQNLMLTPQGRVVLIDFGIASRVGTRVMTNRGTPSYQSPDIRIGVEDWDISPDLFAVGIVLYELICHDHPYEGGCPRVDLQPRDPRQFRPTLSPNLVQFLLIACAPYRHERYSSARNMRIALEAAEN